jgi:DNA polymerase delta subunit 1
MNWIELAAGKYSVRHGAQKISNCQIECCASYRDIISHTPEGEWAKIAPLRVLSFDIECAGRPGIFPEATVDPVIQIANVVTTYGMIPPPQLPLSWCGVFCDVVGSVMLLWFGMG